MSGYIYGIICASLAIGFAELLVPEGAKTRPYVRRLLGLLMILAVIKPVRELAEILPRLEDAAELEEVDGEKYSGLTDGALAEAYKSGVSKALESEFSLKDFEVGVAIGEDKRPARVVVTLMGKDIFRDPYAIEGYISSAFGCECVTVIG